MVMAFASVTDFPFHGGGAVIYIPKLVELMDAGKRQQSKYQPKYIPPLRSKSVMMNI
jgi:hypothetical protein